MCCKNIRGVIFDMDGVLVDSERLYLQFWQEACANFGFELSEKQGLSLRSNSPETAIPKFILWFGEDADYMKIRDLRRELMAQYIDEYGINLKDGAIEIMDYLGQHGIKTALATSSPIRRARYYLEPHGLFEKFDAIVSGTSVANGKPAPDIYLKAINELGLTASECMAVEDSPTGIVSAHRAGCFTLMIPDLTMPDNDTLVMTDCVLDKLTDIKRIIY